MPIRRRTPRRTDRPGFSKAVREKLITGHWWEFLASPEESEPSPAELRQTFAEYKSEILEESEEPWALVHPRCRWPKAKDAKRYIRCFADDIAVRNGCWFDEIAADRINQFCKRFIRHNKGQWAGQPFIPLDWQKQEILDPLFGWKRANGTRRFRQAYIHIPKKNGKSFMCSGFGNYLTVGDGEGGAEVYCCAVDADQANIVFAESKNMVMDSPELREHLEIIPYKREIWHHPTHSMYKALSWNHPKKEGLHIHGLIFDELHVQRDREMFDTLRYGGAARIQPLLIMITTAGEERESICYEEYTYACKVRDSQQEDVDTSFFQFIREAADDDDWTDENVWRKANPSLGVTITIDSFRDDFKEAKETEPKEQAFRRYRLNQWIDKVAQWIPTEAWKACADDYTAEDLEGDECFGGMDLSATTDLTAFVLVFPKTDYRPLAILPFFFMPENRAAEKEKKDRVQYRFWRQKGYIFFTPGDVVDYGFLVQKVKELSGRHVIREIGYDPWNATQTAITLQQAGFEMVEIRQGYATLSAPCKEFERLILGHELIHPNNLVMNWCVSNAVVDQDANANMKPNKDKSTGRIDGVSATLCALARLIVQDGEGESIYNSMTPDSALLEA